MWALKDPQGSVILLCHMTPKKNSLFVDRSIVTPWGPIGYVTFKRTYARRLNDDDPNSPTEEFPDVVERELDACERQLKLNFTDEEKRRYAETRLGLKWSDAGRFMWQLGSKTVDRLGLPSLQNCSMTVVDHPVDPFVWAFDMMMLGSGVGFNIQREYVYSLPKLKGKIKIERLDTNDADFIVPDTREGWVKLLGKVLKAHFYGGKGFTFSTVCVRGKGAPIKGFGGVASGPEELCEGIAEIHKILNSRAKKKLRPIDCLDIMNILGSIVVSGNVRRASELAIGDFDDIEFLKAKRWDLGPIPNWRAMSNNSIVVPKNMKDLPSEFWQTYEQGEPYGLINIELSKSCGRLGDTRYKDENVAGFNPCMREDCVLLTPSGSKELREINIGDTIWSKEGWTKVLNKWSTGIKSVHHIVTLSGFANLTLNHRVDSPDGKVEVEKAEQILVIGTPTSMYERYEKKLSSEYLGEFEVFDITVDNDSHTFWCGGLSISNCAEQSLEDKETCCLGTVYLPNVTSEAELREVLMFAYRVCKHSLRLPCHLKQTESIVHKNMRMGLNVTGILECSEEQLSWLAPAYEWLREYDVEYSKAHGWPTSIKLTTVQPSGTLSLLPGVVPGVHPSPAGPYYIRRVRISSGSPLLKTLAKHGVHVEPQYKFDGSIDRTTFVASFPCKVADGVPVAQNFGWKRQLELIKRLQTEWSDNSVSCTVYYKKEELPEVRAYLEENMCANFKTLSFLCYEDHGFKQAPYETISKEQHDEMMKTFIPINSIDDGNGDDFKVDECAGGSCPIK